MKKQRRLQQKTTPVRVVISTFLMLYAIFFLAMFVWTFLNSLKGQLEYNKDRLSLPKDWLFSNYKLAMETLSAGGHSVTDMIFNALWLTVGGIIISQACIIMFAYAMARYNFPLKKLFNTLNIIIIMIPIVGSMPSFMRMLLRLGIYDSPWYLLTQIGGFGASMIIYRTVFRNVPWDFAEAAYIDGANHWQVFLKLMVPQIKPLLIANSINLFRAVWNDYMTPLLYLPSFPTLSSGLYVYEIEMARKINTPVLFAGCFLCAIPPVLMFIFFNKKMMEVDLSGGLKG